MNTKNLIFSLTIMSVLFLASCSPKVGKSIAVSDVDEITEEVIADWDYALVHIYRRGGAGALVGYDIHYADQIICRAKNNWGTTIKIRDFGQNTVWAKTESKVEIPVNFEPGREYYIRCGMKMGIAVGRPTLELVNKKTGKTEYESVKTKE